MKKLHKTELKKIASELWNLELKCQKGENVSDNMQKMEEITNKLSFYDLLKITNYMEAIQQKSDINIY